VGKKSKKGGRVVRVGNSRVGQVLALEKKRIREGQRAKRSIQNCQINLLRGNGFGQEDGGEYRKGDGLES